MLKFNKPFLKLKNTFYRILMRTTSRFESHLYCDGESGWVQGVFPVQLSAHFQGSADVVESKHAVGVTWWTE